MELEQAQRWRIQSSLHAMKGNEILVLNDPQQIWIVEFGSLAVFAVPFEEGHPEGERRHLFNVTVGQAMFGAATPPTEGALGLIAVALEPTELSPLPLSDAPLESLLNDWMAQLSTAYGSPQPQFQTWHPTQHTMQYGALLTGQTYQPQTDTVVWIQIQAGKASWMGHPELPMTTKSGFFPLGQAMWFEAAEPLEFAIQSTANLERHDVLNGLTQLHTHFLRYVESVAATETQAALQRFQERQHLNRQVTQQAIHHLVSVFNPQQDRDLHNQTPLLIAAGAIARAMGITISPPMKSEDLSRVQEPLEAIARASQLRLRRVLLRDRWWQKDGEPILAYTRMDKHPVALLPRVGGGYDLFDPIRAGLANADAPAHQQHPNRARLRLNETLAATLDPVAYVFYQPLPSGSLKALDLLKFALKGRRSDLFRILWTGVAATLLGMLVPQATALLIDDAIPNGDLSLLLQIGLGLLAAAAGGASFQLTQAIASMRIESLSDASLQAAVWDRLLKLKTTFFRQYAIGDLNSRVSGISAIRRKLSGTTLQTLFTGSFALLNLGLLFYYSPPLATLALGVALVIMVFTLVSGAILVHQSRHLMELEGNLFGIVVQLVNGVSKLRIAGVEERAFAYWGQKYAHQLRYTLSTQRLEDMVDVFTTVTPALTAVVLFWLASRLITPNLGEAGLSVGTFLAFNVAFGIFISGVTSLSLTFTEVLGVIPLWQRSLPILSAEPEISLNKADPGRLSGSVRIDHVTFRYRDDGALILNDVSIQANPGEFIALVGPSGSGKSTVLRLLLGFEEPISGTVYYDGQDLAGLDVAAVRRQLGVVLQNGRINAGSIFENIASGALISLDEAWAAAENSGLADDIRAMPMQMHTIISEGGTNLSGGQRQRLVIARALALQPRILLLDEATSALDNRTQAIVSQSLDRLKATRIVIAHRLSTIRNADRIYVLEAGRVVQQGTFDELAHQPGLFAQLISRQIA
ncbi:NHLP bacteriocin export ABC transporter permease/ATPase subunit [Oscillatoria sp. FACHB-1407]|uniref:NHLP bacteriocin export ABC transporter permease/ATPase subunit n=1 Tax=Oscillatoria sp. FACHB-1407 TaxID=2692847 RepID=UPI00168258EE|nr:NHLP bacteriocin export ABC transporter permease/ATPase subunit [Oscillatoria sp. FACHB-1407]MBD2462684.1 NHLP bacteriocin export ABC transporter permease/ATPase subunit [Oscillatoria sp. FACHB-1407]